MRLLPFEYAVRNLGRSAARLIATVLGSAIVVLLVLAAMAFVRGMRASLSVSGETRNVIVLGAGSEESIERSEISASVPGLLAAGVSGIRERFGTAYVSPEVHVALVIKPHQDSPREALAVMRGVTHTAFLVHSRVRVVEGRPPRPGANEIMVGNLVATRLGLSDAALAIGNTLWFDDRDWTITGRFHAPNTVMDAEVWCPLNDLLIAARRTTLSGVIVTLDTAEFADVDMFCKQRLDLELVALRESDYYANLLHFYRPVRAMVWATAALIGLGGLLGGLNTLYAAFASRIREIATLRTLGYARTAILVSLVQESMLVTSAGALLAAVCSLLVLNGVAVRFSMGAFGLVVDAAVLLGGLTVGLLLGIAGALPPAWRCMRVSITDGLRMN